MTQRTDGGRIVPFPSSPAYVRRKALENRREGRLLEAMDLFRRAMELDPSDDATPLDLAELLSEVGCFEQSNQVLYRLLSRSCQVPEAYYGLAANHLQLMNREEAMDSAANYLALEPEGIYSEEAQDMIDSLLEAERPQASARQQVLLRQGIRAKQRGERDKAAAAFERALRASRYAPGMRCVLGLFHLEEGRPQRALQEANRALKADPGRLQARCLQCQALYRLGYQALAKRLLASLAPSCHTLPEVRVYCHTAQETGDEGLALLLLRRLLRSQPYAIPHLHRAALALWRLGKLQAARRLWRRILRIDPGDDAAKVYLSRRDSLPPEEAGWLPKAEIRARIKVLLDMVLSAASGTAEAAAFSPQWEEAVVWAFCTLAEGPFHQVLLKALEAWPRQGATDLMRRLLMAPRVPDGLRRLAVSQLITLGEKGPFTMLYNGHITQVDQIRQGSGLPGGWRRFLQLMLLECRGLSRPEEAVVFAGQAWLAMTPAQRLEAVGEGGYAWVCAVKLLHLEKARRTQELSACADALSISVRRVERIMNQLDRQMNKEGTPHEAH